MAGVPGARLTQEELDKYPNGRIPSSMDSLSPLWIKCMEGDCKEVEKYLDENPDVDINYLEEQGRPALWVACRYLVEYGAVAYEYLKMVKLLVNRGADIHIKTKDLGTPMIMRASGHKWTNVEGIEFLLQKGADVNSCDNRGCTLLMYACMARNKPLVELLLKWGADKSAHFGSALMPLGSTAASICRDMNRTRKDTNMRQIEYLVETDPDRIAVAIDATAPRDLPAKEVGVIPGTKIKNNKDFGQLEAMMKVTKDWGKPGWKGPKPGEEGLGGANWNQLGGVPPEVEAYSKMSTGKPAEVSYTGLGVVGSWQKSDWIPVKK